MSVDVVFRGNIVTFTASFLDKDDNPVTPASAFVRINYKITASPGRATTDVTLTVVSSGSAQWSGTWETTGAIEGMVYWSTRSTGPHSAEDGQFFLSANIANPSS